MFAQLLSISMAPCSYRLFILLGIVQSVVAGAFAGMASKILVYPMDVAKKRLQVQVSVAFLHYLAFSEELLRALCNNRTSFPM